MKRNSKDLTQVDDGIYRKRRPGIQEQLNEPADTPLVRHPPPNDITLLISRHEEILEFIDSTPISVLLRFHGKARLPALPQGYYFKGGAARELMRGVLLGKTQQVPIRDYDLVRFLDTSDEQDHRLALKFMPDDYEYGRGVEAVENRETYFISRDLTVNEVLYRNGMLEASYQALRDLSAGALRPTPHVTDADGNVLSATIMKIIRFAAEAESRNIRWSIEGVPSTLSALPFDIALNLDRALASSEEVACEYLLLAWEKQILLPQRSTPPPVIDAVRWLSSRIRQGVSLFRNLPPEVAQELARNQS